MRAITINAMWWRRARRTMCPLATGYTNSLRHAVLLNMSKCLSLKTEKGIWDIPPHSKVEKTALKWLEREGLLNVKIRVANGTKIPLTFRHILWTFTTPSDSKEDFGFWSEVFMCDYTITKVLGGVDFHLYLETNYALEGHNLGYLVICSTF